MIEGKTKSGFSFKINEDAKNDIELIEELKAIDDGDLRFIPNVIEKLLGNEQKKALYEHLRTDKGTVPIDKCIDILAEMLNKENETKNSSSSLE